MKKYLISIFVFASACVATKNFAPTNELLPAMQQKVPGITLEQADKGYKLYQNKCAGCHRLHSPSEYKISRWEKNLIEMYPKAKITSEEEKQLIKDYLFALSK